MLLLCFDTGVTFLFFSLPLFTLIDEEVHTLKHFHSYLPLQIYLSFIT